MKTSKFKNTEIGPIPSDWELTMLGKVSDVIGGSTPNTNNPSYWNGYINWYTPTEIGNRKYSFESNRKISQKGYENSTTKILPLGAILLTTRATIGDVSILLKEACTNQGFQSLVPKKNINNEFLYYLILTKKKLLIERAKGSTFLEISPKDVKSMLIPLPPLPEQKAIAEVLSDTDELITKLEQLIAKKKLIKQGTMQQLLTGKKRLPGFSGKWETKKLGEVAEIRKGVQINKDTLNISGKYPVMNGGISPSGYTSDWNQYENTIIISEGGNSCGYVNFMKVKFWQGGHCYSLTTNANKEFLYQMLKCSEQRIMSLRVGSGLPNIQNGRLSMFQLILPAIDEQTAIAQVLSDMDAELEALEQRLEKYQKIKQGMMQELLTGRVRLV